MTPNETPSLKGTLSLSLSLSVSLSLSLSLSLKREADRLYLTVNLEKTNIMVFRMGGHLAAGEKRLYDNAVVKVTNACKYL